MTYDPVNHDLERGMSKRRQILGDAWVDRSLGRANNFNAEFQSLITRLAWNEVWGRPGIDEPGRRMLVLAVTMAMGRWEEFDLHARAALLAGADTRLSPEELKEVLIQTAIYAGVPAANTAFNHVEEILREIGPQIGYELRALSPFDTWHPGAGREGTTLSSPSIHYSVRAARSGPARGTVVLSHALGCDLTMWDELANELAAGYNVIAYDHRGHGSSEAPTSKYTMAELADDAHRLLKELECGPVIWIGLSMGGMVGQELALAHPEHLSGLVIANSSSHYPEAARTLWRERMETVRDQGIDAIADAAMGRYFTPEFQGRRASTVARFRRRLTSCDPVGYIGCCNAVSTIDTTARLRQIKIPTLVLAGELDQGTPVAMSEAMAREIPGARLRVLPKASHLSVIEQAGGFSEAVREFLTTIE